ncbi:MAG: hypothetical protein LC768_01455 [Acidobacteria bacterium]|nr:hypothetical protein [Acidobacteriota bacterium]MCA1636998.1 hypothetical protein [Acidobacteriota bacterium]
MRNQDNTKTNQHKNTVTAHIEMMLMIFTLAAVSFACGFYLASAHIAAMLTN